MADSRRSPYACPVRFVLTGLLLALGLLQACASHAPASGQGQASEVVATALDQIGRPYRYGGREPSTGFDCSGLVTYAYAKSGVALPRETGALLGVGRPVDFEELAPADLVFFRVSKRPKDLHVGLFVGGDEVLMVHSPKSGDTVRTVSIATPWWRQRFIGGRRILEDSASSAR